MPLYGVPLSINKQTTNKLSNEDIELRNMKTTTDENFACNIQQYSFFHASQPAKWARLIAHVLLI